MSQKKSVQAVILTGMSGSGKSTALKAFEDIGYFCVDNLPTDLLESFISLQEKASNGPSRVALVMDVREKTFLDQFKSVFAKIRCDGFHLEILFLDAKDEVLMRRFSQTRRHHPLQGRGHIQDGIDLERRYMHGIRELADRILDTSDFNVHQLRQNVLSLFAPRERLDRMVIHVLSFGFKYGVPADANLVLDVRFLPNPYFEPELRALNGSEPAVRDYVLSKPDSTLFLEHAENLLNFLIPQYRKEGKSYLVIAVGCTGGRHRSVAIVEYLRGLFSKTGEEVIVTHRDLDLEA